MRRVTSSFAPPPARWRQQRCGQAQVQAVIKAQSLGKAEEERGRAAQAEGASTATAALCISRLRRAADLIVGSSAGVGGHGLRDERGA